MMTIPSTHKSILMIHDARDQMRVNPMFCPHDHLIDGFVKAETRAAFVVTPVKICAVCCLVDPFHASTVTESTKIV